MNWLKAKRILPLALMVFVFAPLVCKGQALKTAKSITLPKECGDATLKVLERTVCFTQNEKLSTASAFSLIFFETQIPSGISEIRNDMGDREQELPEGILPVVSVLNRVTERDHRYEWRELNGVINVGPRDDYTILDTPIAQFDVEKAEPDAVRAALLKTPEYKTYLRANNLVTKIPGNRHGTLFIGLVGKLAETELVSIHLTNATFREILNESVRKRGHGTWTYHEYQIKDGKKMYRLSRLEN